MDTLYLQNKAKMDAAIWPLGKPEGVYEPPLWQEICNDWVEARMRPVNVSHLIAEIEKLGDAEDPDSTAYDIRKAEEAACNWEEVATDQGWRGCDAVIEELTSPGDTHRTLLAKLLNLIFDGVDSETPPGGGDMRFYWICKTPEWEGDSVVEHKDLFAWSEMTDTYIEHRIIHDTCVEKLTGEKPQYVLCSVSAQSEENLSYSDAWDEDAPTLAQMEADSGHRSLEALPPGEFLSMDQLLDSCDHAVTAWVISEWLETQGFVNFDDCEWSSETTWQDLGNNYNYDDMVTRPDVMQWFLVNDFAGNHLRELGGVVVDACSGMNMLYGRTCCGQSIAFDGNTQQAMIRSGYLSHVPPLGALNLERSLPRLNVSLGGEEFPFQIRGYSEHRPDRELNDILLADSYREAGWVVEWGPSWESQVEGIIRTFRLVANKYG